MAIPDKDIVRDSDRIWEGQDVETDELEIFTFLIFWEGERWELNASSEMILMEFYGSLTYIMGIETLYFLSKFKESEISLFMIFYHNYNKNKWNKIMNKASIWRNCDIINKQFKFVFCWIDVKT